MNDFESLRDSLNKTGVDGMLATLADILRKEDKHHELFEALKMRVRHGIGLPLMYGEASDNLIEAQRTKLEEGLLAACREVGSSLLQSGKIREGWMYLRPVGEKAEAAGLLQAVEPNEENLEELIEVLLHEGVDVPRGYGLVLEHYGVCNSITTFDTQINRASKADQKAAATLLVRRLHADLLGNVKYDIARQEGSQPTENTLKALVADRDWLLQDGQYHIDTTHLSSTVRIARILETAPEQRLALDLTEYGRRLAEQFQSQGDEPFAETYPAHALYYQALLGENLDEALAYFRKKAEELDVGHHGPAPAETYIDLLSRLGRKQEAIDAALKLLPEGTQPVGIAPSLYELSKQAGDYSRMVRAAEERGDVLSFAAGLAGGAAK